MSRSTCNQPPDEVVRCRFLVVGSGIAGLWTALHLAPHGDVTVITKSQVRETNTQYAQGGIAVALPAADSPELHKEDTLDAGAGLCDEPAVDLLTREGPDIVRELIRRGAHFDSHNGELLYGREAAHGRSRILHSHGDATGAEVQRTATEAILGLPAVTLREETAAADLLLVEGQCAGVEAVDLTRGRRVRFVADCTCLATGGAGSLYRFSTNPPVATADGPALAYRAGARVRDLEFVQFHPTALAAPGYPKFLISEAVRGEGAWLVDGEGHRFMPAYHELAELAPRDVVARAVFTEMQRSQAGCAYLDFSPLQDRLRGRFPGIVEELIERGFDPFHNPIPITPAAHYSMGGITADLHGFTGVTRLYACGECADYGVHGANRLASNSLLDGLVFGKRSAAAMAGAGELPAAALEALASRPAPPVTVGDPGWRERIQQVCWEDVGIVRTAEGLQRARTELGALCRRQTAEHQPELAAMEAANLSLVGWLTALSALTREESRGAHFRTDFPESREEWRRHLVLRREGEGVEVGSQPVLVE